ncbi:thiol peroxidase [Candidatus Sumerlaeota bacterium]|nr:thiol peroxidase [Candidatus Sumerlaeota bacterium]
MTERAKAVTFKGEPLTLMGGELRKGDAAPAFALAANDLSEVKSADFSGKVLVLSVVPSLDTGVCAAQTRRFNKEASDMSKEVAILTVSRDLPFAQVRFCAAEGIDRVLTVSDYRHTGFGVDYGVLIEELALLTRAVFVVDRQGKIVYAQYVREVTDEPDYAPALKAVAAAL